MEPGQIRHVGRLIALFVLAGLIEIGGGYLIWLRLRVQLRSYDLAAIRS